jgi:hypothetical protein
MILVAHLKKASGCVQLTAKAKATVLPEVYDGDFTMPLSFANVKAECRNPVCVSRLRSHGL